MTDTIGIPLRFVETQTSPGVEIHPDWHIEAAVERANGFWAAVGIEFWIKSIDRFYMPNLNRYVRDIDVGGCPDGQQCFTWAVVRDELRQVLPQMPTDAYPDGDKKSAGYWLHAASALYSDTNEILIWLLDQAGKSGNGTPQTGRMVFISRNNLWVKGTGGTTTLGHEIGHFFGALHTNDADCPEGYDACDRWEEVFVPGSPNVFFASPPDDECVPSKVKYIHTAMTATSGKFGPIMVVVNGQSYAANGVDVDPEITGLVRATGDVHDPPGHWGFGLNAMCGGFNGTGLDSRVPRFFTASQKLMMRDFLSRDVDFDQANRDRWLTESGKPPKGALADGLTSLRSRLGKHFHGTTIGAPAAVSWGPGRLDVFVRGDGDRMWHKPSSQEHGWSYWQDLGGRLASTPAAVSWAPGRLDVFSRTYFGHLIHKRYSADKGWSEWRDLEGQLTSAPAAVSWAPGHLDVFARGAENELVHKRYNREKAGASGGISEVGLRRRRRPCRGVPGRSMCSPGGLTANCCTGASAVTRAGAIG